MRHLATTLSVISVLSSSPFALANKLGEPAPQRMKLAKGEGPRIVYLHGLGGGPGSMSTRFGRALAKAGVTGKMVAPWLRPMQIVGGGELRQVGNHTMSDQIARAKAIIEEEPGPVVLIGHSFGGKLALKLALDMPDRVVGVVGLAPSVKMLHAYYKQLTGRSGLPADKAEIAGVLAREHARLVRKAEETDFGWGDVHYNETMADLIQHDEPVSDRGPNKPMLVFHGTHDQAVSIHYVRRLAQDNPAVTLKEYAGFGHGLDLYVAKGRRWVFDRKATNRATGEMARLIKDYIDTL